VPDRRVVRVTAAFFEQLDQQLGTARGDFGEPSATDFLVIDLPVIVESFAVDFDDLPLSIEGVPSTRVLIIGCRLVRSVAVYGLLAEDGGVDLIGIEIDL
jgi:hypothetical protein